MLMVPSSDFWELPASRNTGAITDAVEQNYYSRCPPEKRPFFMRDTASPSVALQKDENHHATEHPATSSTYDESLFKTMMQTFKRRIWASGLLLLASGVWSAFISRTTMFELSFRYPQDNDTSPQQSFDHLAHRVICLLSPL